MVDSLRTLKVHCLSLVTHWLHLVTIGLVGDNREFQFEAYFEVLYPFGVVGNLRTLKDHPCLSLVAIDCP